MRKALDHKTRSLDLDDFLPFRMAFTSNLVSDVIATTYSDPFNLRVPEWRLITVIAENEGLSQQAICGRTRMDKVTVGRIACALEQRGLIERAENSVDRRSRVLTLTASGRAVYAAVAPKALRLEARILNALEPDEALRLGATLAKIDAVARLMLLEGNVA
jgi:DNA-binding MarR family transcriptional regulator